MTQPIKLTVNINPASAVRAGRSQCGTLEVLLTDDMIAQLDVVQREYLAMHLDKKREQYPFAGTFDHGQSLGTPELAEWSDETLGLLLHVRIAQHTAHKSKDYKQVLNAINKLGEELVRPPLARISKSGWMIDGYHEIALSRELQEHLPEGMAEVIDAENALRRAHNEQQLQRILDERKEEEQRAAEAKRAWRERVLRHMPEELITREADGLDREGEWNQAWNVAELKTLGIEGYEVTSAATSQEQATPEQYAVLRQERENCPVSHSESVEVSFLPAVLDDQFVIELKLVTPEGTNYAVKRFPEISVEIDEDNDE